MYKFDDLTDGISWPDQFQAVKNPNNGARPNSINRPPSRTSHLHE
jgi:hypothetical protein